MNIAPLDRIGRGPLVGRARELAEARAALGRALAGEGRVVLISGEPGVGKTYLAREIMAQMRAERGFALSAECYAEGDGPYASISRMIRESFPLAASLDLPETVLADLIALAPVLRSNYPAVPANPDLDPRLEQQRLFESVATWCEALSTQAPLLLLLDDLQWADTGTLFLLRHLARRGRKFRLLLVLTLRDPEQASSSGLGDFLLDLNRERLLTHLELERLDRDETGDLLATMLAEEISPDLLDGIYAQTEGNPFFVEEVCRALIEEGKLVYREGHWHPAGMAEIRIPQTVRAAILARVARISQPAQEALRFAAILGPEFDFETLQRAAGQDEETLVAALESALAAQLISEVESREATGLRFRFAHILIATALRESTIHLRRRLLHGRVAQALEAFHPDDFQALAYHYAEAGNAARAHKYFAQAGNRAQTWAPEDAVRLFRAALVHWPEDDVTGRAEVLGRLGYCLWVTADLPGALACFEASYRLFDGSGLRLQSGEVQRMIGRIHWAQGERKAALEHYHQALEILEQGPETVELARAISAISQMHMLAPEPDEALAWGRRALDIGERLGGEDVIVHALNNIGSVYCHTAKNWEEGFGLLQESLRRALAMNSPADACRAYYNIATALHRHGRYAAARDSLEQLHAYAAKAYMRNYAILALWRLMWVDWETGRWSAALAHRSRLVELGGGLYTTWARRLQASIDLDVGRIKEARQALEETLLVATEADDLQTTVPHLGQLIRTYEVTGQTTEAADTLRSLLACLERRPHPLAECVAPLLFACRWLAGPSAGHHLEHASACLSRLEWLNAQLKTGESGAALAEARACLLLAAGRPQAGAELLTQAAIGWETLERPFDQARALGSLGRMLKMAGQAAKARATYAQALSKVEALAGQLEADLKTSFLASPFVEQMRAAAVSGAPGRNLAGLTDREIAVLRLVAQGLTNAQIAESLVVSPLTINAHLRSIFNKLDVTRRAAAARIAVEHGLV